MEGYRGNKKPNYWNKENTATEAFKYTARKKFSNGSRGAYKAACKNGWMDEICSHMSTKVKPAGYWTKVKCIEEASKYKLRSEFHLKSSGAYSSCLSNGWLEEVCSHMKLGRMPNGYWNFEKCELEAINFKYKKYLWEKITICLSSC
jgi:hypothetical protein